MHKPGSTTARIILSYAVILGLLFTPTSVALADGFQKAKTDYAMAVKSSITAIGTLRDKAREAKTLAVASKNDDAATVVARKSLEGYLEKVSELSSGTVEDVTVFNMASLTDTATLSTHQAQAISDSISKGVRRVNTAIEVHQLRDLKKNLSDVISNGREIYESSDGKVDSKTNRDKLSQTVKTAKTLATSSDIERIEQTTDSLKNLISKVNADVSARQTRLEREAREAAEKAARQVRQSYGTTSYGSYSSYGSGKTSSASGYSSGYSGGYSGSSYSTSSSCTFEGSVDSCQSTVDGGGLVDMDYAGVHIYAQHSNTGGSWINGLQAGQTFTLNGSIYRVNGQSVENATNAPDSGTWMQTCNGNGNHLVGVTKIS